MRIWLVRLHQCTDLTMIEQRVLTAK